MSILISKFVNRGTNTKKEKDMKTNETKKSATVYVVAGTKGGVGKSLISLILSNLLQDQGRNFKIIEIDDNNDSLKFKNSSILNSENAVSFKVDMKNDAINDMFFDLMEDETMDYIIDCGGGNDTKEVLKLLGDIPFDKKFLLPCSRVKKYIKNADETFEIINEPENTFYVLNQYFDIDKLEEEFLYFFGNEKLGIKPASKYFSEDKYFAVPFSNSFQIAEDEEQILLDLASISQKLTKKQAIDMFYEKAKKDRKIFNKLMPKYQNSCDGNELFKILKQNFSKLF